MRALHAYAARVVAAGDYVRDRIEAYRTGSTPQQARSARLRAGEFAAEGQTVERALALDTPESDVQLTVQLAAWDAEISRLLTLPRARTADENAQLASMTRQRNHMQARLLGAGAVPEARLADFGDVQRPRGFLGALVGGGPMQWIAAGGAALGVLGLLTGAVQGVRADRLENQRDEARADMAVAMRERDQWKVDYEAASLAAIDAAHRAATTRETLNQLERQRAAAAAAERRRQNDVQNVIRGVGDPPDLGLRDDASVPIIPGASADPAARNPS